MKIQWERQYPFPEDFKNYNIYSKYIEKINKNFG